MKIYVIRSGPIMENTYLLVQEGKALVIDAGAPADVILRECRKLSADPIALLLTHGHIDHILGAAGLQRAGVKVYAGAEEFDVIAGRANLALALRTSLDPFTPDVAVRDEDVLSIGPFSVRALFTPGHTKGGYSYLIDGSLFSGDTLFCGSYGRTDFPTGDEMDLVCSIANVLFSLPPETEVYAGHSDDFSLELDLAFPASPDTTIGNEYSTNPILNLL